MLILCLEAHNDDKVEGGSFESRVLSIAPKLIRTRLLEMRCWCVGTATQEEVRRRNVNASKVSRKVSELR